MADLKSELERLKKLLPSAASRQVLDRPSLNRNPVTRQPAATPQLPQVAQPVAKAVPFTRVQRQFPPRQVVISQRNATPAHVESTHQSAPPRNVTKQAVSQPVAAIAQSAAMKPEPVIGRHPGVERTFRPLPKGQPTRHQLFRNPEPWVARGGKTQLNHSAPGRFVDIVIGLDFGTSYTKAAVGFMDKIFPVTWEGVSKCMPNYLLPSEYTTMDGGHLYIGQYVYASTAEIRGDLKLPFINPAVSTVSIADASVFLALILRYIRAWVYQHHAAKIGQARIRWQLNIGAPSNGLEIERFANAYRTLAATAWIQSRSDDPNRVAECRTGVWKEGQHLEDLADLQIRPEFVAQMAGYMQSPQRRRGLHALIDVGGGTLDIVTFIVHKVEDEDTFPFLVPEVHALGTHGLIQNRLVGASTSSNSVSIDELQPVPSPQVFAKGLGVDQQTVIARDRLFSDEVCRVIGRVFEVTRNRRYRLADAWTEGVRTFFTGGGSNVDLYLQSTMAARIPSAKGLLLTPLPPHPKLDGFSGNDSEYQRISVACGLAQDSFTLGRVVPAKEVEDDRAIVLKQRERLDRDDLYPK